MGRPTKLTPVVHERVVQAIRAGNYAEAAARAAGISPSTYYRWLERGAEEKRGIYRDFSDAVEQAEADAEVHAAAVIRKAMSDDWRAALAYLERRHPERWRRREKLELARDDGFEERGLDLKKLSEEELRTLEELHRRAAEPE